jgi:hypothetical protein
MYSKRQRARGLSIAEENHVKVALAVLLLSLSADSTAGIFSGSLSDKDAASIHKIAVFSLLGDTLHLDTIGLTVFGNQPREVPVPQWRMDAVVTEYAIRLLQLDNRFTSQALQLEPEAIEWKGSGMYLGPSTASRRLIVERARAQAADAVLLIEREINAHDQTVGPGFGLYNRHLLGKDHVSLMGSLAVVLIRVDGARVLAQQHPDPLTPSSMSWPMKTTWEALAPDEQRALEDSLKEAVLARIRHAVTSMKIGA